MTQARQTEIKIIYEDTDISADISPYLLNFTFNDNISGKADDISFSLEDREFLWGTDWLPTKGDKVRASIVLHDDTLELLPCGLYEVDQIEYSSPPRVIAIKAVSAAVSKNMKDEKHSRAWENTTLSTIAGDLANENSLKLFFDCDDINYERKEQHEQSDMQFLELLCTDAGLNLKINEEKIIIFSGESYEEHESVTEIDINDKKLISFKFQAKTANIYRKAHVKYHDAIKDETFEGEYEDENVEGSQRVLEIRERVESIQSAKELAQKRLYEYNKSEVTGTLILMGDLRFSAGNNITLSNFGAFSGKYWINKAVHQVGSSYTTTLTIGMTKAQKKANKKAKKSKQKKGTIKEQFYEGTKYYGYDGK